MTEFIGETHTDHFDEIQQEITLYQAALRENVDVHYWSSPISEIMATRITMHGEEMLERKIPPRMSPELVNETETLYAGVMSPDMLRRRIEELKSGNNGT